MRIAVVAPSCPLDPALVEPVTHLAAGRAELIFHPQCFLSHGHFAGDDQARLSALVEVANDRSFDAIWFARGGYGAGRIAVDALAQFGPSAHDKLYMGYSDAGFLLAGLDALGIGRVAHGPMPSDIKRTGGEAAVTRALDWFQNPKVADVGGLAFNMTVLSHLLGTGLEPDFAGRILMLEEVDEHHYRIDRSLCHIMSMPSVRRAKGLMLGRCAPIPENDRPFFPEGGAGGMADEERIARHWCDVAGIAYLGRADIGHDAANKVVHFAD